MKVAGLVLAAGAGTRFGAETKQLAPLRGKPLLQHAVEAMNAVLPCVVVLGHDVAAIRAQVDFGPAETVVCEDWARGQGFSLRRGVAALPWADAVVITLGDQPFITSAVIEAAILASRLHMLPREKVERELGYLQIAVAKTAGPREHEAWRMLVEKIEDHYKQTPG